MSESFVHLHVHTEYSMLDGAAKVSPLVQEAARLDMPAIAMSDHGNVFGAYEFHGAAKKAGVKPIIGIEAYVAPSSRFHKKPVFWGELGQRRSNDATGEGGDVSGSGSYTHMTMWAADADGLRNLFKLSSRAWLEGFYRKWPRMDDELLAEHAEGIIATTACPSGEVQTRLRLGQYTEAVAAAAKYRDIFGPDNYFLELMDHGIPIERRVREDLLRLGRELNLPPLVTNDSHYVTENQAEAHDALLCVGVGKQLADADRFRFSGSGYYIKPAGEMRALWDGEVPGGCDNTLLIAERIGDYSDVFAHRDLMPQFPVPDGETESSWLRKEALQGARLRYRGEPPAEVLERIDYELGVIGDMGFPGYFLVVADICRHAREHGIGLGPGRGSATGSMVSYCTGITDLDPIEHGLIFERFLNPERISMPDVDLDLDDRGRGEMIDYVTRKYGEDRTAQIITFGTLGAKAAVKDSCRIHGLPYALGDKIAKAFPAADGGKEIPLAAIFDDKHPRYGEASELRKLYEDEADVKRIVDTAVGIEGLTRNTGIHAAGVILSRDPLMDVLPVFRPKPDGPVVTGFPYAQAEDMGLLKMDFLGLRNLTVIGDAVTNVKANRGVDLDMRNLPLDDAKTYELLARGDTLGVFQLDGGGMRTLLRQMQPTEFTDIAAVSALYRPGPMEANAHTNYALRKTGKQAVDPIHPELKEALDPILGDTYHLVVFQEQVMAIAQQLAGYTLGGADMLRRAMGKKKKEVLDAEWGKFSAGMAKNGFSVEATKAVWDVLVPFSGYGFNRCVSGDTVVTQIGRSGSRWQPTARNLANRIHGREDYDGSGCRFCYEDRPIISRTGECSPCRSWRKKWRLNHGMIAAGRVGDRVLPVKVTDVFRQGAKPVWKMTLADGSSLTSTKNHRHLTPNGWRHLDQLAVGDEVSMMADGDWETSPRTDRGGSKNWVGQHGYVVGMRSHGKAGPILHGRSAEFKRNVATLARECAKCGSTEGRLERAHLDGNPMNNSADNLAILCNSCHKRHDYANGGRTKRWNKGRAIESSRIISIEYVGMEMTYDVTVDSEDHSWVANGSVVTHNSHTAGYGVVSYWTAYLKANYPAEYMAALLTSVGDNKDKMAVYLAETRKLGIKVLPPDVNESQRDFTAVGTDIRFGLGAIRNVGDNVVAGIVEARKKGAYTDFADFLTKVPLSVCNKRCIESLVKAGAFDSLKHERRGLVLAVDQAVDTVVDIKRNEAIGQDSLFGALGGDTNGQDATLQVDIPVGEWDKSTLLGFEREMLGLYVSSHPLDGTERILERNRDCSIAELLGGGRGEGAVKVAGIISKVDKKVTKKTGNMWAIATIEDHDGSVEALFFPKSYELYGPFLAADTVVSVAGRVDDREGTISIVAQDLMVLDVSSAQAAGEAPVVLVMREERINQGLIADLKRILQAHPGKAPVHLQLQRAGRRKGVVLDLDQFTVDPSSAFHGDIKSLLGAAAISS